MPSSAGGVSGSSSGAPRPPGAEHPPGHRGCAPSLARPGPSRCPAELFGLQRLWQDGGCREEQLLPNCAAVPGPASGGERCREPPAPPRPGWLHLAPRPEPRPQHRASSLIPTACAAPPPSRSPLCASLISVGKPQTPSVPGTNILLSSSSPSQPYVHA